MVNANAFTNVAIRERLPQQWGEPLRRLIQALEGIVAETQP
ncbi:MAG: hypothetical protein AAF270_02690 [Pseudomonadota bacterium]